MVISNDLLNIHNLQFKTSKSIFIILIHKLQVINVNLVVDNQNKPEPKFTHLLVIHIPFELNFTSRMILLYMQQTQHILIENLEIRFCYSKHYFVPILKHHYFLLDQFLRLFLITSFVKTFVA